MTKNGSLTLLSANKEIVVLNDVNFALIQRKRSEMISQGYKKENLKIHYSK